MRIQPVLNNRYMGKTNNLNTQFERKTNNSHRGNHQYTGVASTDLAYASMFDSAIARDLKLMGLI